MRKYGSRRLARKALPKFAAVAGKVRAIVRDGQLPPGGGIPSEASLCGMFRCSRGTVRRAIGELVAEGLLRRVKGSGTFVASPSYARRDRFIGVIMPTVLNGEVLRFFEAMSALADARGYRIVPFVGCGLPSIEAAFIHSLDAIHVAGIARFPTIPEHPLSERELRDTIQGKGIPLVAVNDYWGDPLGCHHICVDETASVDLVASHLRALGHRRIAWADSADRNPRVRALRRLRQVLAREDLELPPHYEFNCLAYKPLTMETIWPKQGPPPTAVVTPYDGVAMHFTRALRASGLRVPEDVSVVSLNGPVLFNPQSVDLTCVVPPVETMTGYCLDLLLANDSDTAPRAVTFSPKLQQGATSGVCRERPAPMVETPPAGLDGPGVSLP